VKSRKANLAARDQRSPSSAAPGRKARSAAPLQRISHRRLVDVAFEELRKRIVSGAFPMGSRLNEVRLAADLGVSRAPVREAVRRLSEIGLVVERPHQGAVVRDLDAAALVDLYNVRTAIEPLAIRLATRRGFDTKPLRALVDRMAAAARSGDYTLVARHELDFHATICSNSGNEILMGIFRGLEGLVLMGLALDDSGYPDLEEVAREHEPLIDLIDSGDENAAAKAMTAHVLSHVGYLIERFGGNPDDLVPAKADAAGAPSVQGRRADEA
jgi:DNA-binding GntR family transcriptional regulator